MQRIKSTLLKIANNASKVFSWSLVLFLLAFFLRIYTFIVFPISDQKLVKPISSLFFGAFFDYVLYFGIAGFFVLLISLIVRLKRIFSFIAILLMIMVFCVNVVTDQYMCIMRLPLDESLFFFSLDELSKIAGVEHRLNTPTLLMLLTLVLSFYFSFRFINKKVQRMERRAFHGLLFLLAVILLPFSLYTSDDSLKQNLSNNRANYFLHKSIVYYFTPQEKGKVSLAEFKKLESNFFAGNALHPAYPCFHKLREKSSLSPYFPKSEKKPNIVFILCESLSSDLVGDRAFKTGHLMPFLDSLSGESLYWPNGLSTSQRTQNVLPATLCSVPNNSDGGVFQQMDFPDHYSLLNLLKKEYYTRFYCGVLMEFSNMRGFMNYQQVDQIVDKWEPSVQKHSELVKSPWGFPDEDLFVQEAADRSRIKDKDKARFDVFLTISTHDPFVYPKKESYAQKVLAQAKKMQLSKEKAEITALADKLGAYTYLDDCLRDYFAKNKGKADYENTIFVITGDHGTEQLYQQPISKYKVPIIVYSPMLKGKKKFLNLVSHNDIPVSILNLLKTNFGQKTPDAASFMGRELDTRKGFHFNRSQVFTTTPLRLADAFHNGFAYIDQKLYKVDEFLDCKEVKSTEKVAYFKEQLRLYQLFSNYVLTQNHFIPQSEFSQWVFQKRWKTLFTRKEKVEKWKQKQRFFRLGKLENIHKYTHTLKIQVKTKVSFQVLDSIGHLPDFIVGLNPKFSVKRVNNLFKNVRPVVLTKFENNKDLEVLYNVEFKLKDFSKFKNRKDVYLYMYNPEHRTLELKDIRISLFQANR